MKILKVIKAISLFFSAVIVLFILGIMLYKLWYITNRESDLNYVNRIYENSRKIDSIKYQDNNYVDGKLIMQKNVWKKGQGNKSKKRAEDVNILVDNSIVVSISDYEKNVIYLYQQGYEKTIQRKIADSEPIDEVSNSFEIFKPCSFLIVGEEFIEEKNTVTVECFMENLKSIKYWIWKDYGIELQAKEKNGRSVFKRENIEVNKEISDDLFLLPKGAQITD